MNNLNIHDVHAINFQMEIAPPTNSVPCIQIQRNIPISWDDIKSAFTHTSTNRSVYLAKMQFCISD